MPPKAVLAPYALPRVERLAEWAQAWRSPGGAGLGVADFFDAILPQRDPHPAPDSPSGDGGDGYSGRSQQPPSEPVPGDPEGAPVPGIPVSSRTGQPEGVKDKGSSRMIVDQKDASAPLPGVYLFVRTLAGLTGSGLLIGSSIWAILRGASTPINLWASLVGLALGAVAAWAHIRMQGDSAGRKTREA